MKGKNDRGIKKTDAKHPNLCMYFIVFFLIIMIPFILEWVVFDCTCISNVSNDAWASFFGSYFGGILGGAATLYGVVYSIRSARKEAAEEKKSEVRNQQKQCAMVIYYDFKFAFESINSYLANYEYEDYKKLEDIHNVEVYSFFRKHRNCFDQIFLQQNWVETVAQLIGAEIDDENKIGEDDIESLYRIYGNLKTTVNWLRYDTPVTGEKALRAIFKMWNENELDLNNGVLYQNIKKIAFEKVV